MRMSKIRVDCPKCNAPFKVDEKHIGKKGICSKCGERFVISQPQVCTEAAVDDAQKQVEVTQPAKPQINANEQVTQQAQQLTIKQSEPSAIAETIPVSKDKQAEDDIAATIAAPVQKDAAQIQREEQDVPAEWEEEDVPVVVEN
jgi:predicted Zn finger-like uncharacterized protein